MFGANFHPHLHVLVTDGVFTPDGRFLYETTHLGRKGTTGRFRPSVDHLFDRLGDVVTPL